MRAMGVVEVSGRRSWENAEGAQSLPMSPSVQGKKCGRVQSFAESQTLFAVLPVC